MSFIDRIKAFCVIAGISFESVLKNAIETMPDFGRIVEPPKPYLIGTKSRGRVPHSNRDARRRAGLPHGVPGAKLARRAAEGRIGVR